MQIRGAGIAAALLLAGSFTLGCGGISTEAADSSATPFLRSDSPELMARWQSQMLVYQSSYQDEAALIAALALEPATRTLLPGPTPELLPDPKHLRFQTATGRVEIYFGRGLDQPFSNLDYFRRELFRAESWSGSADLRAKWEAGARVAADYLAKLSTLRPVVFVGNATDADYAAALTNGYQFFLSVDGWRVWEERLVVQVDASGVYQFTSQELVYAATPNGTIDCRTEAEVHLIVGQRAFLPLDSCPLPPIFYAFNGPAPLTLSPYYLARGSTGNGVQEIPLDRTSAF